MSDTKLRELERRWRESGTVEDEAAFLRENLRAGLTDRARLGVAATFGHAPAREVFGESAGVHLLRSFSLHLQRQVFARMALSVIERVRGTAMDAREDVQLVEHAIAVLRRWCLCPCEEHATGSVGADRNATTVARAAGLNDRDITSALAHLVSAGCEVITADHPAEVFERAGESIETLMSANAANDPYGVELIPWALGRADPLRDRIEADERIAHALEMTWRESGRAEDGAAFLRTCVVARGLHPERIELASLLGDPAAGLARGHVQVADEDWPGAFGVYGREAAVRVSVAAGRCALGVQSNPDASKGLDMATSWLACPCAEHLADVARAAAAMPSGDHPALRCVREALRWAAPDTPGLVDLREEQERVTARVHWLMTRGREATGAPDDPDQTERAVRTALGLVLDAALVGNALRFALLVVPLGDLREAIRRDVVPWALGRRSST
jgi:hypothetical protein